MKRVLALCLVLLALPASGLGEKADRFPDCFRVTYSVSEKEINSHGSFVSKDIISTVLPTVDEEINGLADQFEAELSDALTPDAGKNPRRNSRLDIHVVNTRAGESAVSVLVLARESYYRKQKQSPIAGRVYDMATGQRITLDDLFAE